MIRLNRQEEREKGGARVGGGGGGGGYMMPPAPFALNLKSNLHFMHHLPSLDQLKWPHCRRDLCNLKVGNAVWEYTSSSDSTVWIMPAYPKRVASRHPVFIIFPFVCSFVLCGSYSMVFFHFVCSFVCWFFFMWILLYDLLLIVCLFVWLSICLIWTMFMWSCFFHFTYFVRLYDLVLTDQSRVKFRSFYKRTQKQLQEQHMLL